MRNKIIFIVILFFIYNHLIAQVKVSPEIGFNYRPYTLLELDNEFIHNKPELYFNINGVIKIKNGLFFQTKFGYIFRKNTTVFPQLTFNPEYIGAKFVNQDLMLNISILYNLTEQFQIGIGGGFYHKLNSRVIGLYENMRIEESLSRYILPNTNILFGYNFSLFNLFMNFHYYPIKESINSLHLRGISNSDFGISLGVSYDIFSKSNR